MYSSDLKNINKAIRSFMIIGSGIIMLTGCNDNTFEPVNTDEQTIRFEVETNGKNDWQSRSSNQSLRRDLPSALALKSDEQTFYLVPEISLNSDKPESRGSLTSNDNISSFGVFAAYRSDNQTLDELSPDYMYNLEITASNNWMPTSEYMWPGSGNLHITAYSPFTATVNESGITRLPALTDKGELTMQYIVPATVSNQIDLMTATPTDASSSPCKLQFNHVLTSIKFETGAEMYPVTIEKIEISGVANEGTLNLETSKWSDITGEASFSVEPAKELTAADGSQYVAPNTPLTNADETFILIPQSLKEGALLSITLNYQGKESTFTTSLEGITWEEGTTVTYHLSINPVKETLVLDVNGDFNTKYTGETIGFTVKSNYTNGVDSVPVKWIAEFIDNSGNVIDRPAWITNFTMNGNGDTNGKVVTQMQDFVFVEISKESQKLQDAADINISSGFNPYNLSSSTGSPVVENTANCYIINAPGTYSLPLVYGNAIKNGSTNSDAYTVSTHARYMLTSFLNNFNQTITDPYIYNNQGCDPDSAYMVWEDRLNLVRNVKLSDDKKTITFDVPHNSIRQGNAMIAIRDKDMNILWSWHIWVTDYKPDTNLIRIDTGTSVSYIFHRNIGQLMGDDITNFKPCSVKIRFTQTDVPHGLEPQTKIVELNQSGTVIKTEDCFTYYQWGRKDPIMANVTQWYDGNNQEITQLPTKSIDSELPAGEPLLVEYINTPMTFWTAAHNYIFNYVNLWNIHNSRTETTKTIYDPSPIGYKVPLGNDFDYLIQHATFEYVPTTTATEKEGIYITTPDGDKIHLPLLGYRSGATASEVGKGLMSESWYSSSSNGRVEAYAMVISLNNGNVMAQRTTEPRTHALGVRPVKE
ncbi:MAG: fimbrillin family protein [Muribaculaceae bacterium]|nr:fimbrillin family protein [Muribaculaceae bacterium]